MSAPVMSDLRIVTRNENWLQAVRDGEVVASARRKSPGSLWNVVLMDQMSPAPHVKISRRLPKDVQRKLLTAVLEHS